MLKMTDINKKFNLGTVNETTLFTDLNFKVNKGEFVSVIGSNGSGKTTLLNLISGSVLQDSGKVLLNNTDISHKAEFLRNKRIGRVFQDPSKGTAPIMTIAENLAIAENKGKIYGLTKGYSLKRKNYYKDVLSQLGLGLENKLDVQVGSLSGGQRQALALLISTLTPIDLLLLDEHTAALDPKSSEAVMQLTEKIINDKKITTLMVTHNLRFAVSFGSRLVMMDKGQVILDKCNQEKACTSINDILKIFNEISIECGN